MPYSSGLGSLSSNPDRYQPEWCHPDTTVLKRFCFHSRVGMLPERSSAGRYRCNDHNRIYPSIREAIDPHIVGHLIEEGIRRFFQRSCDIQTPVAPFFPVTITFFRTRKLPPAGVKQRRIARDHSGAQCRNRHIGFNCRRGRINPCVARFTSGVFGSFSKAE